jgi:hypothetical protein
MSGWDPGFGRADEWQRSGVMVEMAKMRVLGSEQSLTCSLQVARFEAEAGTRWWLLRSSDSAKRSTDG